MDGKKKKMKIYELLIGFIILSIVIIVRKCVSKRKNEDTARLTVEEYGDKWRIVFRDGLFFSPYPSLFNTKTEAENAIPICFNGICEKIQSLGGNVKEIKGGRNDV